MSGRRPPLGIVLAAVAAGLLSIVPIIYLFQQAITRGWGAVAEELFQERTALLVGRSLALMVSVAVLATVLGVAGAWLATRSGIPGRRVLLILLALPLAVPSYLAAFAWISWLPDLAGFTGAVLVLTLISYPFVLLPVAAAMRRLDPAQHEVARSLGRSAFAATVSVTLRQTRAAIAAGALLVSLYVLADFGAVAAMRFESFTWVIYGAYRAGFNPSRAAILALVLLLLGIVLTVGESRARGRASSARVGRGVTRTDHTRATPTTTILGWGAAALLLALSIGVPVVSILDWMQRTSDRAFVFSELRDAFLASFEIGLLAALATILLAIPVGVGVARYRGRVMRTAERSTYIAHAIPGIVIAIAVVYVGIRLLRPIYQQLPLLIIALVILFLPLAVASIRTAIEQSTPALEEAARSLGVGAFSAFRRVTLPLAAPGIAAAAALVMLAVVKELPATLLLRPTGMQTLATRIWDFSSVSDYASAGPYALALLLVAALPTALLSVVTVLRSESR